MTYIEVVDPENSYKYYIYNDKVYVSVVIFTPAIKTKWLFKHWINHYDVVGTSIEEVSHQSDFTLVDETTAYILAYTKIDERFFVNLINSVNRTCRVFKNSNSDTNLALSIICKEIVTTGNEAKALESKISELRQNND